jgi:chromosome segregation ATPase
VAEIRDQVSNLYDIVGALPSIDTLETKIAAVDGAIEEMNATMEKLVELGERLQKIEGGEAATERVEGRIAKMEEALANSKSEFDKKVDEMKKVSSDGLKAAEAQAESLAVKISGLSQQMEKQEDAAKKVSTQIGVLDRNLRSAVEGYTKVYEGAGRTEKRFLEIEAFLGNAESRLSAIEANFGPGQQ